MKKKLFYIANIRMPTERAHGIQVMHMCAAFARAGVSATLLVPNRATFDADPFEYYGAERAFRIEKIPAPDTVGYGALGFIVESLVFAYRAAKRVNGESDAIVYTREELPLLFLPSRTAFYEAHQLRSGLFLRRLVKRAAGIVAITAGLARAFSEELGVPNERLLVAPDGFDEKQFSVRVSKEEARARLNLPRSARLAVYIGGLDAWKGSGTLLEASEELSRAGIVVVLVGGGEEEIEPLRRRYPRALFLGERPYRELAVNQQAADVLVVPNSARERISRDFTSPLKLFAHMASLVPLVVSDLPSLREIVSEEEAVFFTPDDPKDLARAIKETCADVGVARVRAENAGKKAVGYTWENRAGQIIDFLQRICYNRYSKNRHSKQ